MTKQQAMKIMVSGACEECTNDFKTVIVFPENIENNLVNNDYELNLDWIQDFDTPDGDIVAGCSLRELEVIPF